MFHRSPPRARGGDFIGAPHQFFHAEDDVEHKFEPGNAVHELAASLEGIVAYLPALDGESIIGNPSSDRRRRVPTVSFVVEGCDASGIPLALDREKVAVRFGHFYAHRLTEALGLHARNGVVRVSMVHYNTPGEVERLVAALDRRVRVG